MVEAVKSGPGLLGGIAFLGTLRFLAGIGLSVLETLGISILTGVVSTIATAPLSIRIDDFRQRRNHHRQTLAAEAAEPALENIRNDHTKEDFRAALRELMDHGQTRFDRVLVGPAMESGEWDRLLDHEEDLKDKVEEFEDLRSRFVDEFRVEIQAWREKVSEISSFDQTHTYRDPDDRATDLAHRLMVEGAAESDRQQRQEDLLGSLGLSQDDGEVQLRLATLRVAWGDPESVEKFKDSFVELAASKELDMTVEGLRSSFERAREPLKKVKDQLTRITIQGEPSGSCPECHLKNIL